MQTEPKRIELTEDYHRSIGNNLYVRCKAGSVSNYASIPSIAHRFFKPDEPIIAIASIVHDVLVEEFTPIEDYTLYCLNAEDYVVPVATRVSWTHAADIFHLLMIETAMRQNQYTFYNRLRISAAANAVRLYRHFRK